ncbi:MAG: acyl-CoA dehydrogenase family protein [Alphaproteobacteria bacterium]
MTIARKLYPVKGSANIYLSTIVVATDSYIESAKEKARLLVCDGDTIIPEKTKKHQFILHGLAWLFTYAKGMQALAIWAEENQQAAQEHQHLIEALYGYWLQQLIHGVIMAPCEVFYPSSLGLEPQAHILAAHPAVKQLLNNYHTQAELYGLALQAGLKFPYITLSGDIEAAAKTARDFANTHIRPHAWHNNRQLIPLELIAEMGRLGFFGVTFPEHYGGSALGKLAMVRVTEEISRISLIAGSLGTRAEIAGEMIYLNGTPQQKERYLSKIATGEILTSAVFTEPNVGSDLANVQCRAEKKGDFYYLTGEKTWITHGSRSHLMTVLARTNPDEKGYKGLSMFLVEKTPENSQSLFPDDQMEGTEIETLGYRGLGEYNLHLDGLKLPADALLGGEEGQGFKQLMRTFESARIQTAARGVGVALHAVDLALSYATTRQQFGRKIGEFPRISIKLGIMMAEAFTAQLLTHEAARKKDTGQRCDQLAGMAKLLAARVAWNNADMAMQIWGAHGYAADSAIAGLLCDARILSVFEGSAEIQAEVIARSLLQK